MSVRKLRLLAIGMLVLGVLVIAGCGGSEEDSSSPAEGSAPSTEGSAPAAEGSAPAEQAETISATGKRALEKAYFTLPEKIPPVVVEALEVAEKPVSPAIEEKAIECFEQTKCQTGHGELVVAITDSFGDIPWRAAARLEGIMQLLAYPQVKEIIYSNAHGNQQQAIADFQAAVAQEVNIITAYFDFASAMTAQFREAEKAGIVVAAYISELPEVGEGPTSALQYGQSTEEVGVEMAERAIEAKGKNGTAALLTGTPGNPTGEAWRPTAEKTLKEAGWKIAYKGNTDWTPAGELQAASTIISKGEPVDAILYDGEGGTSIIEGFQRAGEELPAFVTWAATNPFYEKWQEVGEPKDMFTTEAQAWCPRIAITAAIKRVEGEEVPGNIQGELPFVPVSQAFKVIQPTLHLGPGVIPPMFAPTSVLEATVAK